MIDFLKIFNDEIIENDQNNQNIKNNKKNIFNQTNKLDFFYKQYSNIPMYESKSKINFNGSDTKKLYEKNLSIMPEDWHYRTKKVFYDLNSYGYRAPEWEQIDWNNSIVIFGCSQVFGVGLAEDETISYNLHNISKTPIINMGFGGGSNDIIFMNCVNMINNFGFPKAIVIAWTYLERFAFINKHDFYNIGEWTFSGLIPVNMNKNVYDICYNLFNYRKKDKYYLNNINYNYKIILSTIIGNNCKFIDYSILSDIAYAFKCENLYTNDKARDLMHLGKNSAANIANFIYNKL